MFSYGTLERANNLIGNKISSIDIECLSQFYTNLEINRLDEAERFMDIKKAKLLTNLLFSELSNIVSETNINKSKNKIGSIPKTSEINPTIELIEVPAKCGILINKSITIEINYFRYAKEIVDIILCDGNEEIKEVSADYFSFTKNENLKYSILYNKDISVYELRANLDALKDNYLAILLINNLTNANNICKMLNDHNADVIIK